MMKDDKSPTKSIFTPEHHTPPISDLFFWFLSPRHLIALDRIGYLALLCAISIIHMIGFSYFLSSFGDGLREGECACV